MKKEDTAILWYTVNKTQIQPPNLKCEKALNKLVYTYIILIDLIEKLNELNY